MATNESTEAETSAASNRVKFLILISLEVPAIVVSLLIFAHFLSSRTVRSDDHQHSIFVLLAINFLQLVTAMPMPIDFYHLGGIIRLEVPVYCLWWRWYEFSIYNINNFLMGWISIERHMLIFHRHLIRGGDTWTRWSLHVAPVIVCGLWAPLFYMLFIIISPMCTNIWTYDSLYCGLPCYVMTMWNTFDVLVNLVFTIVLITVMNLALILRVVKRRANVQGRRQISWRQQRKMVLQLVTLSSIYIAAWLPLSVTQLGQLFFDPTFLQEIAHVVYFLYYIVPLTLPIICLPSIPQLFKRMKLITLKCQWNVVTPAALMNQHV